MALQGREGNKVKLIGFYGATSIGKTTATYLLSGRLRTHGISAIPVADSARGMSFPPTFFDTNPLCYSHVFARKLMAETEAAMRPGAECIVSDRTLFDWVAYYEAKHPTDWMLPPMRNFAKHWLSYYDALYYFPIKDTELYDDGFREADDELRKKIDSRMVFLTTALMDAGHPVKVANGTYRERMEFVYHDILAELFDKTRAQQIRTQLEVWLAREYTGWPIKEVRVFGSNSITRFHTATDHDDFDLMVVLKRPSNSGMVKQLHDSLQKDRKTLEPMCQATLDLMVCTEETMPHEA